MTIFLSTVSEVSILFIVTVGLALILGLMDVINLAHPGLMAVGAYGLLEATRDGLNPWLAVIIGTVVAGMVGLIIEWLVVRRLYARPLDSILATWGIALVLWQVPVIFFGLSAFPYNGPAQRLVHLGPVYFSEYRLLLMAIAVGMLITLVLTQRFTKIGLIARAVMTNEQLARGLGVNTRLARVGTFVLGSALAGAAGALLSPIVPINPYIGFNYLIPAFLAVLLAGKTLSGLVLAVILLAAGQTLVALVVNPIVASVAMPVFAVIILRLSPRGFGILLSRS